MFLQSPNKNTRLSVPVLHSAKQGTLPILQGWIHEDKALLEKASEIKAIHQVSLADAWIGACAILQNAQLVHKDPELEKLDCDQLRLPYKNRG
ncbi:MAG: PIN domain-containing protein [Desulfobacterales bacterium]|nr:PIN domain-containing protein [Desulfobacterales bacterium]